MASGYEKCKNLMQKLISEGREEFTENELKLEIAKNIGFCKDKGVIPNYWAALLLFKFIKMKDGKYVINKEALNG